MPEDTSALTIPNDISYLPIVGAYVTAAAAQRGFDENDAFDIRLAVDEACTHIIETAFEPGDEQDLTISCQRYPSGLRIRIADKGMPFDPDSIKAYDAGGGPDRDLAGLPFHLIQQAVDEVRFINRGWEGKELQLTKLLKVPGIDTYLGEQDLLPNDTEVEPAPPGAYEVRLMEPDDAVEIARCVYKTYGYTYPGEEMYFPERVVTRNQSGEMISAVAVAEDGEVIGHCALSGEAGGQLMEIGQAAVAPEHRGRGVAKALMDLLMHEARQRRLAGLYAQAITIHPFSQRAALGYGFRESAVLLGYAPRHVRIKKIAGRELPQRETVVYAYRPLAEEPSSPTFAPAHHRSIVARIYDNLGLERELLLPTAAHSEAGKTSASVSRFGLSATAVSALGLGQIDVSSYGPGIEEEVRSKLRDLCHEGISVIYLSLPAGDPQTALLCQRFEQWGFFFCGIKPRPNGKDMLCLQLMNGPRIDYDRLQIHSDFGKELVSYIRGRDPLA